MRESVGLIQTQTAYTALRNEILSGRLRPGIRLKVQELSLRFNVSPGAVREALARLLPERLVVSEAWKGFRVAPVSIEELEDVTRVRVLLETICLRQSIAAGTIEWEVRVVAAHHRLMHVTKLVAPAIGSSEEWGEAHADYHLALVEGCGSPWLLRLREILWGQSERYRRLSSTVFVARDGHAEHSEITDAVMTRDADRACRLITDHFWTTARALGARDASASDVDGLRELAVDLASIPSS